MRHGDEITGATTFRLEEGLDTGPVFGVVTEADRRRPTPRATCWTGWPTSGAALLVATLDGIADGTLVARPQPADGVSHAPKVTADGRPGRLGGAGGRRRPADPLGHPGARGVDHVPRRAARPRPGRGPPTPTRPELKPGELHVREAAGAGRHGDRRRCSWARCARSGKRPMPAADWARGVRIAAGGACSDDRARVRGGRAGRTARQRRGRRGPAPPRGAGPPRGRVRARPGRRSWTRPGMAALELLTAVRDARRLRQPRPARRSCAGTGCATATPRWPPSSATARCAPRACSTR